jgi:hypothetical protein
MPLADPAVEAFDPDWAGSADEASAGFKVLASLSVSLGQLAGQMQADRDRRQRIAEVLRRVPLSPLQANPQAQAVAGTLVLSNAEVWGPKTGFFWAVQRITIAGLASAAGTFATGAIATGAGSATLPAGSAITSWTVTFSVVPTAVGTITVTNAVGGTQTYSIPVGATSVTIPYSPALASAGSPIAVTAAGLGLTVAGTINVNGQSSADAMNIYKGSAGAFAVVPQNQVNQAPVTTAVQYSPGRTDLILQPGDFLVVAGTGLLSTSVTVSADMDCGTLAILADYLL